MKARMLKGACAACLILFVISLQSRAQTNPATQEADALYQAQKWTEAAKAYEAITKAEPSNGRAWNRLGSALKSIGKYEQAVEAYQHAVRAGVGNPAVMYNLATAYSKMNNKEKAFEWLRKALDAGFMQTGQLETDPELAILRDDSRFKEIMAQAQRNAKPCAASPEHRQFDFWIGEWDVQNPQGQPAGTSSIQLILGDCTIFENWTSGGAYTGKSFNLYNSSLKKWQQFWADDKGGVLEFTGEYKDGELRYTGESLDAKGNKVMHRLTFFNLSKDRVRQLWEQSTDNAKTWTIAFDGLYVRKK